MTKNISKLMRESHFQELQNCLNKKCKIVKPIDINIKELKLLNIDTAKGAFLFQILNDDEWDKLLLIHGITMIYIGKK